jgi:GTP-binding protein EngB required for normal cell division
MNVEQHIAHRAWAFQSLDALEAFLADPDFVGDAEDETRVIGRKRRELKEGKYRVVILGEFNVGKSALINAFLGDEYLPMVLEECTTKITHIVKSDNMKAVLDLSSPVSEAELEALGQLVAACGVTADVLADEDMGRVVIAFPSNQARDLVRTLRPLVTVSADEDFPQLRTLRGKFDEIHIHLPTDLLADDVALVDSPGVHSISETNTKIAEEIIPNSHLVICLLDSQNPGTEQNRDFIEKVVKHRHRKVMFVINKADQLNTDEIDPKGRRGPAKDLFRSLHGVVEGPEIFFVSALYALVSEQLSRCQTTLADLDNNNKIKIPWALQRELMQREDAEAGVAKYLAENSNIAPLRERLLRYLYTENREGAILESACRFVDDKAWTYARPLQVQLDMARDVPRLAELQMQGEALSAKMADCARRADTVSGNLQAMSCGGTVGDREYPGYGGLLDSLISEEAVTRRILEPAREWIYDDLNYKAAKQGGFTPLAAKVESLVDNFLRDLCEALNAEVGAAEDTALASMGALCPLDPVRHDPFAAPRVQVRELAVSLAGSYAGFAIFGGILCAAAGAGLVASGVLAQLQPQLQLPDMNTAMQMAAGAGAAAGVLAGILLRAATAKSVIRRKLTGLIRAQVTPPILGSGKGADGVMAQLRALVEQRRAAFAGYIQETFESATQEMRDNLAVIEEEAGELLRKQEEIIARLEPKLAALAELSRKATETAESTGIQEAAETSFASREDDCIVETIEIQEVAVLPFVCGDEACLAESAGTQEAEPLSD